MKEKTELQLNKAKEGIVSIPMGYVIKCNVLAENKDRETTRVNKKLFLENYEKSLCSILATCKKVGIDYVTYWRWTKEDAVFLQAIKDSDDRKILKVRELLNEQLLSKNTRAITYYLDRRDPLFKPHSEVETHITSTKTLKQAIEEDEAELNKNDTENQPGDNGGSVSNKGQEGKDSSIQKQSSPANLLEAKDEAKPVAKTKTEGIK